MHKGIRANLYDEDELASIDGSMLTRFGWELVDGLGKVSFNLGQQQQ